MRLENTREKLMQLAHQFMREKGYSAFSYADLANEIGIKKASIHHHFPNKVDLGLAVAIDNCNKINVKLAQIEQEHSSIHQRLIAYLAIFATQHNGLPMCASLVADKNNLPDVLVEKTTEHFVLQLNWLEKILAVAMSQGELTPQNPADLALMVLNLCEGASLVANALSDMTIFDKTQQQIFNLLGLTATHSD